ncbi:MAG: DUF624 domain-containing protein [Lachnospiraceae bacterium]|nr:DUF624 domain-containing protein [Lachnospiraceae bacterium]
MDKFFSTEGKFFRGLEKIVNVVYLNILWIIFSLPIITIGASTTALFSVMMKLARDREGYIFQGFWKAFKENFKQSTLIWLIDMAIATFLVADMYFFFNVEWSSGRYIGMIFIGVTVIFILGLLYMFPLQAQFENKVKQTIRNAFFLASKHFSYSVLLLFILLLTIFLMYLFWYIAGWCIIGIGAFVSAHIYNRIFKKYIPEELRDEY